MTATLRSTTVLPEAPIRASHDAFARDQPGLVGEHPSRHCRAARKDGRPCRSWKFLRDGLCAAHDPDRVHQVRTGLQRSREVRMERARTRRAFAPVGMPARPPQTLDDAKRWAAWAMFAVATGVLTEAQGQQITRACSVFVKAARLRELEREKEEMREQLRQREERRREERRLEQALASSEP